MDKLTVEKIAIEFAKYLMQKSVRKHISSSEFEDYIPKEYKLLNGELIQNGSKLFGEFMNDYYAE